MAGRAGGSGPGGAEGLTPPTALSGAAATDTADILGSDRAAAYTTAVYRALEGRGLVR
jgi:hypothetical protein